MRLITRITALPLIGLVAGLGSVTVALPAQAVEEVDESILWVDVEFAASVEVAWEEGGSDTYEVEVEKYCTGFFVSAEAEIVTAGHCVEVDSQVRLAAINLTLDQLAAEGSDITGLEAADLEWETSFARPRARVGQPTGVADGILSGQDMLIAQIVDWQSFEDGDNALLRVADLKETPGLPVSTDTPAMGQEVTAIGFPGSVSAVSDVSRQAPSYKSGTVSSRQYTESGVPNTEIDAAVSGGMSGGPTLDAEGGVLGVNSFGIGGETQPFNFVTDTETLRDFLSRNGVQLAEPPAADHADGETPATATDGTGEATASTDTGEVTATTDTGEVTATGDTGSETAAPVGSVSAGGVDLAVQPVEDPGSGPWMWVAIAALAGFVAAGLALALVLIRRAAKV